MNWHWHTTNLLKTNKDSASANPREQFRMKHLLNYSKHFEHKMWLRLDVLIIINGIKELKLPAYHV